MAAELQVIELKGRLETATVRAAWREARHALRRHPDGPVAFDASGVEYCDGAGIAMLVDLLMQPRHAGAGVTVRGLPAQYRALLDQFGPDQFARLRPPPPRRAGFLDEAERAARGILEDIYELLVFVGATAVAGGDALLHPWRVRWRDVLRVAELSGSNAVPIVSLISFLLGVILAYQSAAPMRMFGAEIFVADLLGLAILRELGPLMTAIVMAGRTGASFAAELGTMKVNEEINALTTMGLDPVRFLVTPRVLATLLVSAPLVIFADIVALVGGALVMRTFDIPTHTFFSHMLKMVGLSDLFTGLFKSVVFGGLIAGIGCQRGLQTGAGASAVGISTTRAVVTSLLMLVVVDGFFAILFSHLGI